MNFIKGTIVGTEPGTRQCYISMHTYTKHTVRIHLYGALDATRENYTTKKL